MHLSPALAQLLDFNKYQALLGGYMRRSAALVDLAQAGQLEAVQQIQVCAQVPGSSRSCSVQGAAGRLECTSSERAGHGAALDEQQASCNSRCTRPGALSRLFLSSAHMSPDV